MTPTTPDPVVTQEEILRQTRTVSQGLETLKTDHVQMLSALQMAVRVDLQDTDSNIADDKINILTKSLEKLELGIGEAQVLEFSICFETNYADC